jgi:hypothetical protein
MLTVLGGLAEFERTLIKARTGEGRERAKGRSVRFGRPLKCRPRGGLAGPCHRRGVHGGGAARPDRGGPMPRGGLAGPCHRRGVHGA